MELHSVDSAEGQQIINRFAYYGHDHKTEYNALKTDADRKQFLNNMMVTLDNFNAPDGAFWKKLQDTVGDDYADVLEDLGLFDK